MKPPNYSNLNAYRVSIACDQRAAQAWTMAHKGQPLRQIAERFKISRERVRQIIARASGVLDQWPTANEWQITLPLRLRELCVFHHIEAASDLVGILSGEVNHLRGWRPEDVEAARELFKLPPLDDAPLAALDRVLAALRRHKADVKILVDAGIIGAAIFAAGARAMAYHGADIYKGSRRDEAAVRVANSDTREGK